MDQRELKEITKEWLADDHPMPPRELTSFIMDAMPERLRNLLNLEDTAEPLQG